MPVHVPHMDINQEDLPQIESISPECLPLKLKYDECFNKWFRDVYLKMKTVPNMTPCLHQFNGYGRCVQSAIERLNIPMSGFDCPNLITDADRERFHATQQAKKKAEKPKTSKPKSPTPEKPKKPKPKTPKD